MSGDFNGDGRPDLAAISYPDGTVSVVLGNGDGTFQPPAYYPAGSELSPYQGSLVVGDFNGDGRLDLAVAGLGVSVLLGNGDGTFQPPVTLRGGDVPLCPSPRGISMATAGSTSPPATSTPAPCTPPPMLLGNGDGTFQFPVTYAGAGLAPLPSSAGDFNGDGRLDVAVAVKAVDLTRRPGRVSGASWAGATAPFGTRPGHYRGGELAHRRLVAGTSTATAGSTWPSRLGHVSVLLGNGDGTFQPQSTYAAGSDPEALVAGDFNGDGRLDLALANYYPNDVSVLLGNGDGSFQSPVDCTPRPSDADRRVVDFNGDGRTDLVVADWRAVLLGNGDGHLPAPDVRLPGARRRVSGDFNGDGLTCCRQVARIDTTQSVRFTTATATFDPAVIAISGGSSPSDAPCRPIAAGNGEASCCCPVKATALQR